MKQSSLLRHALLFFFCGAASAQMSTLPGAAAIADLPGPPKNPPLFSSMTAIWQGGLEYHHSFSFKGPVARVAREESQTPDQNPDPFHRKTSLTFDEQGYLTQMISEDSMGVATMTVQLDHGRPQNVSSKHHRKDGKVPDWEDWEKWNYDQSGRLLEFRARRDKEQMNWFVNFRYDQQGRSLGYEDKAMSLVEISYSGNKIILSKVEKHNRRKYYEQIQTLDDKKRVIDLKVSDISGGQLKPWYHVAFNYDQKDRVIEQDTDPFKFGSGDDYSPLPGKVLVSYDDGNRTGEQKYYDPEGKLAIHARFEFDRDGVLIKFHLLDAAGNERIGSEMFIDSMRHATNRPGDVVWDVLYDDHGNWTERRRWFIPSDGSRRVMTRLIKQTITYR